MRLLVKVRYYSGQESTGKDFIASIDESGWLSLQDSDLPPIQLQDIDVSPRVGNSMRYLTLPDGATLETAENELIDEAARNWGKSGSSTVHRLERSFKYTIVALVALVFGVYLFVTMGIPALSSVITAMLPESLDDRLGSEVLQQLDDLVFAETELEPDRQQAVRALFDSLVPDRGRNYTLEFRSSELLGANAIALPNAQIVITDQLVELADSDAMIGGIMLHEIGHVEGRHSMQAVVSQAGLSMLIVVLAGDVNTAATTLLVMLPSVLIQSHYSRNLEWAADTYALEQMRIRGLDTGQFADILERMVALEENDGTIESQSDAVDEGNSVLEYFSSHPATRERIQRFRAAAR